jgi:cell division protein YceG involved in septum cleavage
MHLRTSLEVIILVIGVCSFVYKIARLEARIFAAIDESGDEAFEAINKQSFKLDIYIVENEQKQKFFNSSLKDIRKMIEDIKERE